MRCLLVLITIVSLVQPSAAMEKSFGNPEMKLVNTSEQQGRTILRYEHESVPEWGHENPQSDYFFVLPPEGEPKGRPCRWCFTPPVTVAKPCCSRVFRSPTGFTMWDSKIITYSTWIAEGGVHFYGRPQMHPGDPLHEQLYSF